MVCVSLGPTVWCTFTFAYCLNCLNSRKSKKGLRVFRSTSRSTTELVYRQHDIPHLHGSRNQVVHENQPQKGTAMLECLDSGVRVLRVPFANQHASTKSLRGSLSLCRLATAFLLAFCNVLHDNLAVLSRTGQLRRLLHAYAVSSGAHVPRFAET